MDYKNDDIDRIFELGEFISHKNFLKKLHSVKKWNEGKNKVMLYVIPYEYHERIIRIMNMLNEILKYQNDGFDADEIYSVNDVMNLFMLLYFPKFERRIEKKYKELIEKIERFNDFDW